MPRIRSIKPEFYTDEDLQDLEAENPGCYCMIVFSALWGHCDKQGVFPYRPRSLKLAILPFVDYDICKTINLLRDHNFLILFSKDGREYGYIPTFLKHQRLNGKERSGPALYPEYVPGNDPDTNGEAPVPQRGSNGEAPGTHPGHTGDTPVKQQGSNGEAPTVPGREGKGREGKGIDARNPERTCEAPGTHPPTADAGASISENLDLYHSIETAFLSKNDGNFTSYGKEGKAIKGLIEKGKARVPEDPAPFLQSMLDAFWKLRCGNDKFWKGQPFLPSALNASGIWDRVLETMRRDDAMADPVALAVAKGEEF